MRTLGEQTGQTMSFGLAEARGRLEQRRDELVGLRRDLKDGRGELLEQRARDLGDGSVREESVDMLDRLDEGEFRELREIDAALTRIEEGSYGTCIDCGDPIAPRRLAAIPETTRCIGCAEEPVSPAARFQGERHTL